MEYKVFAFTITTNKRPGTVKTLNQRRTPARPTMQACTYNIQYNKHKWSLNSTDQAVLSIIVLSRRAVEILSIISFLYQMTAEYIDIPLDSGNGGVRFFPDELPADHIDLIDVLRSEIPPLKTWRLCAVCYFISLIESL